jgi:hypothetical protein
VAYLWPEAPWEFVARYGQFRSPDEAMEQDQTALGINYLLSANAMAKFAYEFNDGAPGEDADPVPAHGIRQVAPRLGRRQVDRPSTIDMSSNELT